MKLKQAVALAAALTVPSISGWEIGQEVITTSGYVKGHASTWQPAVSEYLGIPFAQPPVGPLRFAAPQRYLGHGKIAADQYVSKLLPRFDRWVLC
jgi:hypothetical protein